MNVLPVRIISVRTTSDHQVLALLGLGEGGTGSNLLSRVTERAWTELELKPGLDVYAQVKAVALI